MPAMPRSPARSRGATTPRTSSPSRAPTAAPTACKAFVDAAHEAGIAVILDVVYNHFGPGDLDLWQFDGWSENEKGGIYFYNDWRSARRPGATRGPTTAATRSAVHPRQRALLARGIRHLDGLRFDMTLYIRNVRGDEGEGDALAEGWSLLRWINEEVEDRFPGRITIAEDLRNKARDHGRNRDGGAGFGAQWDSQFVHPIREVLIAPDDAQCGTWRPSPMPSATTTTAIRSSG
jgi:1,4-alpha-glucan branching enzyme